MDDSSQKPSTPGEIIQAMRKALGLPDSEVPPSKAEVRQWILNASPVAIASLIKTTVDDRVSPEARNQAASYLLKYGLDAAEEGQSAGLTIKVTGGLD